MLNRERGETLESVRVWVAFFAGVEKSFLSRFLYKGMYMPMRVRRLYVAFILLSYIYFECDEAR